LWLRMCSSIRGGRPLTVSDSEHDTCLLQEHGRVAQSAPVSRPRSPLAAGRELSVSVAVLLPKTKGAWPPAPPHHTQWACDSCTTEGKWLFYAVMQRVVVYFVSRIKSHGFAHPTRHWAA